jgi:hypothetical protein
MPALYYTFGIKFTWMNIVKSWKLCKHNKQRMEQHFSLTSLSRYIKYKILTIDSVAEPAPALAWRKWESCVNKNSNV